MVEIDPTEIYLSLLTCRDSTIFRPTNDPINRLIGSRKRSADKRTLRIFLPYRFLNTENLHSTTHV